MLGKQVNFFMQPQDEQLFLSFVFSDPETVLISRSNSEPSIQVIDRLTYSDQLSKRGAHLFWKRTFRIDPIDIHMVEYKQYNEVVVDLISTGKTGYVIDTAKAPVIEYAPSRNLGNGVINRGRIWAGMRYVQDGLWVHKGKEFESWYDRIARWLRKNFSRTPESGFFYLGPSLLMLHQEGKVKYKWPYEPYDPAIGEVMLKG
jgi:hypothetical protein